MYIYKYICICVCVCVCVCVCWSTYTYTSMRTHMLIDIHVNKRSCMYMCIFNLSAALLNLAAYMHIFKHINVLSRAFATKMNKKHPLTPQMVFLPGDHTSRCVLVGESGFYRKKNGLWFSVFSRWPKGCRWCSCGEMTFALLFADGHTTSNAPDLFRPPKLSGVGPGQY